MEKLAQIDIRLSETSEWERGYIFLAEHNGITVAINSITNELHAIPFYRVAELSEPIVGQTIRVAKLTDISNPKDLEFFGMDGAKYVCKTGIGTYESWDEYHGPVV